MPLTDLNLDDLVDFRPTVAEPGDFDAFWTRTLDESRRLASAPTLTPAPTPITELIVDDLRFGGFGGERVAGWVTRPRGEGRRPVVIEYVGYNGGRGLPGERVLWALAGYVHVVMDTRGQGSGWGTGGDTPDPHGSGPAAAGFMTRGIDDPDTYYYRRVFTDAALLVDAVSTLDFVDPDRIAVTGGSQGGGIANAAAALAPAVKAVMPDVPFLAAFRRGAEIATSDPFGEIARYLAVHRAEVDRVFETLSYFDGVNFARRITVPALFSVALMDDIVPPSTIFAAYNHLASTDRTIAVYEFNGHEGGLTHQWQRQAAWLADRL
ncbi:acetylxylan esterase [Diaminobutyricibacter tongyongensis]|uniref:Acetylxylan esterase n=1 Tax=Leifsonia tongyongensis TaxID=1268043 RepID=A0A6L9Y439_9MICO|nr:acetylxylan esterase [Diaminobutyricibacter tongyongensis]